MANYLYQPLRADLREIRLMSLLSGLREEEIKVKLTTVSLDEQPEYEALSYVWGDPNIARSIKLNGQSFQVTENLEVALRRLRLPDQDRIFWIDAICINQNDFPERNSQVLLMREVYSGCKRCVIWLGEEDEFTAEGLRFIKFLAKDKHLREWPPFEVMAGLSENEATIQASVDKICQENPNSFEPFIRFISRPWWSRMWTVQEFVLPPVVELTYGSVVIDWELIDKAGTCVVSHGNTCCRYFYGRLPYMDPDFWACTIILNYIRKRWREENVTPLAMMHYLRLFRRQSTTDPRDKVFALLGLTKLPSDASSMPSYGSEISVVYLQPVMGDIRETNSLRMLHYVEDRSSHPNTYGLPSWVPDWSVAIELSSLQEFRVVRNCGDCFNASKSLPFCGAVYENRILYNRGVRYDSIIRVGDLIEYSPSSVQVISKQKQWIAANLLSNKVLSHGEFVKFILNETYSNHYVIATVRATTNHYRIFQLWWDTISKGQNTGHLPRGVLKDFDSVERTICASLILRRLFVTANGSIGVGPPGMKVGDEVWILCGSRVPMVLKESEQRVSRPELDVIDHPCHTFVGDSFVLGIMDGEAAGGLETDSLPVFLV